MRFNDPLGNKKDKSEATPVVYFKLREPFKQLSLCLFWNPRPIVGDRNFNLSSCFRADSSMVPPGGVNFREFPIKLDNTYRILS
jgi:hypothetical protein